MLLFKLSIFCICNIILYGILPNSGKDTDSELETHKTIITLLCERMRQPISFASFCGRTETKLYTHTHTHPRNEYFWFWLVTHLKSRVFVLCRFIFFSRFYLSSWQHVTQMVIFLTHTSEIVQQHMHQFGAQNARDFTLKKKFALVRDNASNGVIFKRIFFFLYYIFAVIIKPFGKWLQIGIASKQIKVLFAYRERRG